MATGCTDATYTDKNAFYYRFTCYTTGTLGFVIDPINNSDDYDWVLFNVTGRNPNDIYFDATLNVAENWSAQPGNTGAANNTNGLRNCAGGTPNFSSMPTVVAGNQYLLMVSNFSTSQQGYTLTFTGGDAVITDPVTPKLQDVTAVDCGGEWVRIQFNKKMRCNSLAANGSDFVLTPNNGTIAGAEGIGCTASFDMDSMILTFSAPLPPGTYTLTVQNGSDGNTILDNCGTGIALGESVTFTVPPRPPLPMGTVTAWPTTDCNPIQIRITFPQAVMCGSAALDGSDFIVTGPAPVTVMGVIPVCTTGETDGFTIQFTAPLTAAGVYTVTMANGSDGNTIIDRCNSAVPVGSTAQFTIAAQTPIPMGTVNIAQCSPTALTLNFSEPFDCNSIAADGSDFTITGPSPVTIVSAAAGTCNGGQTNTITLQFTLPINIGGAYQVVAAAGSDGNTLTSDCGKTLIAGSTADFTLPTNADMQMGAVVPPACLPTSLTLTFADPVNCNSIAANGSDFIITGPSAVTVTGATPVNCAGGEATAIELTFAAPIAVTGNYQVEAATGSDGNTLTGSCGRIVPVGANSTFTLPVQPPIAMGTITPPPCTPSSITLTFADAVNCNSIAADGSDFIVTGPSPVIVAAAAGVNCVNGETTTITITFSAPILTTGNYQVQVVTGSDGNTLLAQCGRAVTANSNTSFALAAQAPFALGTITPPNCAPASIVLTYTSADPLDCSSVSPDGSEFTITGPSTVNIASVTAECSANPNQQTITLVLAAPINVSGTYQLTIGTGTDGNTIGGNCNRFTAVGAFSNFTIPDALPVPMDSIVPVACSPSSLRLVFDEPIRCASVAPDGSDFTVTGPFPVTITGAAGNCDANGLTREITIQLASPIVNGGNYTVQLNAGSDGNTLLSECYRVTPAGSQLSFTAADTVSAAFQYQIQYDCETDEITFSHNGQHSVNQWTWTVNGAQASTAQTFSQTFSASSQNTIALTVSNGVCSDSHTENIVLDNKLTIAFDGPDMVCPLDTAVFRDRSQGQIDNWLWTFGNGSTSTLQNPPAQVYPQTGIETLYTVSLTISNAICQTTATKPIRVLSSCIIAVPNAFTPNGDGLNDYLFPLNAFKADNLDFKVFNRWGQLVFHSKNWTQKWDGRIGGVAQATGVYAWTLSYTHRDTGEKFTLRGTSVLIR